MQEMQYAGAASRCAMFSLHRFASMNQCIIIQLKSQPKCVNRRSMHVQVTFVTYQIVLSSLEDRLVEARLKAQPQVVIQVSEELLPKTLL